MRSQALIINRNDWSSAHLTSGLWGPVIHTIYRIDFEKKNKHKNSFDINSDSEQHS